MFFCKKINVSLFLLIRLFLFFILIHIFSHLEKVKLFLRLLLTFRWLRVTKILQKEVAAVIHTLLTSRITNFP